MKNIRLDLKTWVIIILTGIVVFMVFTKKSAPIDDHADKIEQLQIVNDSLVEANSLIQIEIGEWDALYNRLEIKTKETEEKLLKSQQEIDVLKSKRISVAAETMKLSADEVSNEFNEYLKQRK